MARTKLTTGKSTDNVTSYTTAAISPGANRLVLAFVMNIRLVTDTAAQPVLQGNGLVWQVVDSVLVQGDVDRRLTCFRAMGPTPTSGPVTISFGAEAQSRCAWSIFEYDEVDTTGADGAGATLQP